MKLPTQNNPVLRDAQITRDSEIKVNFGITASLSSQEADCQSKCASQFPNAATPDAILCNQHCQALYDVPTIL